ncbi:hypothetical protein [Flavobacterium sp. N3904]|uniref:hypothetical protein n=1 Tax=Flavobacterium sp. N3904 TaxID=2986835 RepID=UPI002225396A|nr:hypothetical protein [Flavobacterium sp. N3904]
MKIIFICGSLEQGHDGVGDYTRRLAGELIRQGHEILLIAIYDQSIDTISEEFQESEGSIIQVLRIPNSTKPNVRFAKSKQYISDFNPEWLSLQYVPFSFQKKGLPFGLASQLYKIGRGKKWHIMFHELWVGMDQESPLKHKLWGNLQKYIARKIIKKLAPNAVHTQSVLYQSQLEKIDCIPSYLPLFGNIAVIENNVSDISVNKDYLNFIVFGTIHPNAPVKEFISELAQYGQINKLKIKLNFIGRCGAELNRWVFLCQEQNIEFKVFGEQNSDTISKALSNADWGVSSTPWRQIEKSGTVAAMLEHGLNVICVARSWTPDTDIPSGVLNGIVEYKENTLKNLFDSPHLNNSKSDLKNIANSFLGFLGSK